MQALAVEVVGKVAEFALQNPQKAASWGTSYATGMIQGYKKLFEGAFKIQDRHRSLQLTFVNATKRQVIVKQNHFDSGTWYSSFPAIIPPRTAVVGGVANSQGSILTGVSGGLGLSIQGTDVYIALGFTNPQFGSYKLAAFLRNQSKENGKYGYDNAQDNNPKLSQLGNFVLQGQQVTSQFAQMGVVWTLYQKAPK